MRLACCVCSFQFGLTSILFLRLPHLAQTTSAFEVWDLRFGRVAPDFNQRAIEVAWEKCPLGLRIFEEVICVFGIRRSLLLGPTGMGMSRMAYAARDNS